MDLGLRGRRALVMGASKGLGRAVAEALAAEGAALAISGRDQAALDAVAAHLRTLGAPAAQGIVADVAEPEAMDRLADSALAALGGVDVLVLNHGGPPPGLAADLKETDLAVWFQRMVASPIRVANRLVPAMRERGWGRVVTVGSTGMVQPLPGMVLSNTLRAAIVGWNKTLAAEVAADGVTCNIVAPGAIRTDRILELVGAQAARQGKAVETVVAEREATIPVGRMGEAHEFGPVAAFLASDRGAYVTGSVVRVDGGSTRGI